ncbi:SURF1 family protein [Pseudorhodoplanes sinuspersici]|uniref:SURF1-like protein n=1 Tax=Pseudorhodoplanes sinuspersici TaxID=1235591 RepID=A0A1W6ZZN9_9HYPH|nr:SURF1 family protein [Pseudorhodoplanes sinuspersici]ARQ02857.1 Surfeit locus 1 family protein [Pseudorhodoplanes sinuspersici]
MLAVLAALGVVALTALGVWQLERRIWKLQLIGQVEQRIHAAPVAVPGPETWPRINAADDAYLRVRATGHFLNDRETLVQAVTERGSGYWVITPFRTIQGFTVLVNRGFVPPDLRDSEKRKKGQVAGETIVTGLVRMTEPKGGFLRSNDPAAGHWYSRDVAAIAAARGLSEVAPFFIDADTTPNPGGWPVGGLTVIAFPNNHLVYALTWFALALMLAGAMGFVARDEWHFRRNLLDCGADRPRAASNGETTSKAL